MEMNEELMDCFLGFRIHQFETMHDWKFTLFKNDCYHWSGLYKRMMSDWN